MQVINQNFKFEYNNNENDTNYNENHFFRKICLLDNSVNFFKVMYF